MNGGSEHLNDRSQWARVELKKGNRAHPMRKADIYSLVPGKALRGDQRSIQACHG
jgi:hypothetical protein